MGKGKEFELIIFQNLSIHLLNICEKRPGFFNNDRQALQMCAELIITAISNYKISSRTLKTVFFRTSIRYLSVFVAILFLQRTQELISQVHLLGTSAEGGDSQECENVNQLK